MAAILDMQNFDILQRGCYWNQSLHLHTKFRWNRITLGWDIVKKTLLKWRPSAILNFQNLVFWSCDLCLKITLLLHTKFRINRTINLRDIGLAKRRFSIWRPSAILNLQNFSILLSIRPFKYTLHVHTKFCWNRMISGWDIAIKLFSKWRPSAILIFRNLVFWSCDLC